MFLNSAGKEGAAPDNFQGNLAQALVQQMFSFTQIILPIGKNTFAVVAFHQALRRPTALYAALQQGRLQIRGLLRPKAEIMLTPR
jgi:hypothetical protein